jgi:hypothetical protein
MSVYQELLDAIAALKLPPPEESLAAILVAPTHDGQAWQVDGVKYAPAVLASVVDGSYRADAFRVAERYAGRRLMVIPPAFLAALTEASVEPASGVGPAGFAGLPVITLRAAPWAS